MKLISFIHHQKELAGCMHQQTVYPFSMIWPQAGVETMQHFLEGWELHYPALVKRIGSLDHLNGLPLEDLDLLAPVPHPSSCRDGYAFRQHVATARRNRHAPMIPEFDEFPVFYFTNHNSIQGPGNIYCMPDHFDKLDFELEVAIVICRHGRNIRAAEADAYVGGLMIMNDLSARTLQMDEMKLNLGPAKGKDFCTVLGPWLVTLDALRPYEVPAPKGHTGKAWNLSMGCWVNGRQVSQGNLADMDWTFAEIIERVSYGVDIFPGDVIGSGTVGTGCFLELNGTSRLEDPNHTDQWLTPGDIISLEVEALGILTNTIEPENSNWSILQQKKSHL